MAEILSRYFDRDIQMHSYDNGTAIRVRKDNWEQLQKFFRVRRIDIIGPEEINSMIHCENGAVVGFLNKLYQFLTKRTVQEVETKNQEGDVPPFARTTATQAIKGNMKGASMMENFDQDTAEIALRQGLGNHLENLQSDRTNNPDRFKAVHKTPSKILRGPTRTVGSEPTTMTQIKVKEVKVNKISDKNVAQLRAAKEAQNSNARQASSSMNRGGMGMTGGASITNILDECIMAVLGDHPIVGTFDTQKALVVSFVDNLTSRTAEAQLSDNQAAAVFQECSARAGELADAGGYSPKEFWKMNNIFYSVLSDVEESTETFASATQALVDLGEFMISSDASTATSLFQDFALPNLTLMLESSPGKRHAVLRIMYAFCRQDVSSHIQMIKELQERVPEMSTFVHALTILIFMEKQMNDALLDLYLYYCVIGSEQPSPSLRAASIAMLSVVVAHNEALVTDMLPKLTVMAQEDSWWEVHAQLLVVCSALLHQLRPESEYTDQVHQIVSAIFHTNASLNLRKIGLSYLAQNLDAHQTLVGSYVPVLLSLGGGERVFTTSTDDADTEELPVSGASGGKYRLVPLPLTPQWPGLLIATQLVQDLQKAQPEHMEVEQMQALVACLTTAPGEQTVFDQGQGAAWEEIFGYARDYIFVALCDAECCDLALKILRSYILDSDLQEKVLQEGTLLGSLRLLYPLEGGADEGCQEQVSIFLEDVFREGGAHAKAVESLLDSFAHNHAAQFDACALRDLRADIARSHK